MALIHKIPKLFLLVIVAFIVIQSFVASQTTETLQSGFGQAIVQVHSAEAAGAPSSDISDLVTLLNKALDTNREALQPSTSADKRAILLAQVDQTLATVQNKTIELTSVSREKTYRERIVSYTLGVIVAVLGTMIYGFSIALYRRYRIERTFQMKVKRK